MAKQTRTSKAPVAKNAPAKKAAPVKSARPDTYGNEAEGTLLEKFVLDAIKDIYWAEKNLLKALPKQSKAATSSELKEALTKHVEVTQEHIDRLEQVFEILGKRAQAKKCDAMAGLLEEAEGIISETEAGTLTRDVALIMAAQKVEHYEIATYGGLVQVAKTMGKNDIADILAQTLEEEKTADQILTDIAENDINLQAVGETEEDAN